MFVRQLLRLPVIIVPLLMCGVGCSGPKREEIVTVDGTAVQRRLASVHWLFNHYREHRGKAPAAMDELRVYGEKLPSLEGGPIVLTEEFLTSPRDKKPIRVRFGKAIPNAGDGPLLAHEEDGFNGRRFVIYAVSGRVEELDDARWQELTR